MSALINNAANDQRQAFADVTPEQFDKAMAVNFRHAYFASQAVVPQMVELGGGSIVNMSSITWQVGAPRSVPPETWIAFALLSGCASIAHLFPIRSARG